MKQGHLKLKHVDNRARFQSLWYKNKKGLNYLSQVKKKILINSSKKLKHLFFFIPNFLGYF